MPKNKFERILFILCLVVAVCLTVYVSDSFAVTLKLNDGTEISLDGLSDVEKANMIKYVEKMNKESTSQLQETATQAVFNAAKDPEKLDQWRRLITQTLKDVCNDLNISVNEFVKTPVGLGVAALIFYKVAGKDLLETTFEIFLIIPFWLIVMTIIGFATRYFLGMKTEYIYVTAKPIALTNKVGEVSKEKIREVLKDNEKLDMKIPTRVPRYKWNSSDARTTFGAFMVGIPIVLTGISFLILFL
jgi:hypothetical protein